MRAARSPLGEALRGATRQAHAAVDQHPLLRPLITPTLDQTQYGRALAALHALYAVLEPRVSGVLTPGVPTYRYFPRLDALNGDLKTMGLLPRPDGGGLSLLPTVTLDQRLGALYVLEGSALGGQMIHERIRRVKPDFPLRFFGGTGMDSLAHWADLQQFLETIGEQVVLEDACQSAHDTFMALLRHLDACSS